MNIISAKKPCTYDVLREYLSALCSEYPFLELFSIGKSVMKKELFCIKWGTGKKRIFLNGAHHGMEWITSLLLLKIIETFSFHYQNETSIGLASFRSLYHEITLAICPVVNPDGVDLQILGLTENLSPLQKTRLKAWNNDSANFSKWQANIHGVDLNHNYNAGFEKGLFMQHQQGFFGPGPTRYSGTAPESEPESKAISDFTRSFLPHYAVAYHSQGKEIYYDFAEKATEKAKKLANQMAEIGGYKAEKPNGMASFSGYKDWVIDAFHIPAFTIEVGLGENPLPLSQFDEIFDDNLKMLMHLVRS